jgi:CRP-like cAMP-binding protein
MKIQQCLKNKNLMDSSVIEYISQFIKLTEDEVQIIRAQNIFRQYKKNDTLLSEGEYSKECFFIIQGCVRAFYLKDGEERNTNFFFENQTITPVSYQTKQPSQYYLSCIEDCVLAIGNEERNKKLVEKIPKLSSLISQMNNDLLLQKTLEFDEFKNNNPEERYLLILKNKPELINRIPLYHLATYLGITQISLSRIRNRIVEKNR